MTPAPQTEDLIAQLEALIDKVTPGEIAIDGFNLSALIVRAPGKTQVSDWRTLAIFHGENWKADAAYFEQCKPANLRTLLEALSARSREVERLREALRPFAAVAEHDIGHDEADADRFHPMHPACSRAPSITVGDFRRVRQALEAPHE